MKITIIVVSYNVKYFLEQCLLSVFKALHGIEAEVFVVDNNSVDGSAEMIKKKFPDVNLILNKENAGFARANNQAIRKSKGEYVLLLNPDTVVEEDTFKKIIPFMESHQDAGGLGVQMIDGKGNFLPESKRGLPTPAVAFYKISGLASLFPKSRTFGKYHLGFLDKNKIHEVEVLSGAFMLLRRSALDKTGLLDESFFMYGEDIDLSYRIIKSGFKNYYFAPARIIHYKGESTRKSSLNYVIMFYKAMMIFASKHFSQSNARIFSILINIAIYLHAGAAVVKRFLLRIFLPLCDALLFFGGMLLLKTYWESSVKELHYPDFFLNIVVPLYILIWICSVYLSGGYDQPVRLAKIIRGIITGTFFILVIYALLPEHYRFSRALILLGTAWACLASSSLRIALSLTGLPHFTLNKDEKKRVVIAGNASESKRVLSLLNLTAAEINFMGFVKPDANGEPEEQDSTHLSDYYLGHLSRLKEIVEVFNVNEVIFCAKDISSEKIIDSMQTINIMQMEYKIAPPESLYIIGSNSINNTGDVYFVDINALTSPVNKRNKRLLDISVCIITAGVFPFLIIFVNKKGFIKNWIKVFTGRASWVGLAANPIREKNSFYKPAVLSPLDSLKNPDVDENTRSRLNVLYTREYSPYTDLRIILKSIPKLGRYC